MPQRSDQRPCNAAKPSRILVATDLGPVGDAAVRIAMARAADPDVKIAVCHVVPAPSGDTDGAGVVGNAADDVAARLRSDFGTQVHEVEVMVRSGDPAEQIQDCANAWSADLVVIGRPEHPAGVLRRLFRPGIVDQVVRHSPCGVLVTRRAPGSGRVIVGVDLDQPLPVMQAAAHEQDRSSHTFTVAHWIPAVNVGGAGLGDAVLPVASWPDLVASVLPTLEAAQREAGLQGELRVFAGDAAIGLCDLARELAADLVVVGTHGRSGLARFALGSVAEHVANQASCPVLVVRLGDT